MYTSSFLHPGQTLVVVGIVLVYALSFLQALLQVVGLPVIVLVHTSSFLHPLRKLQRLNNMGELLRYQVSSSFF